MKLLRVAAATLNQTPLDWLGNKSRIIEALQLARARGVGVLCLPELCIRATGAKTRFCLRMFTRRHSWSWASYCRTLRTWSCALGYRLP